MNLLFYISTLLISSSASKILSNFLLSKFALNFFPNQDIPSFSVELAQIKTFDALDFSLFLIFFFSICTFHYLFKTKHNQLISQLFYLIFALAIYFQTNFVVHSGSLVLLTIIFVQIFYHLLSTYSPKKILALNLNSFANSTLVGFYFLLLLNNLTTSIALPLGIFFSLPLVYLYLNSQNHKFINSTAHLFLTISLFFPYHLYLLLVIGFVSLIIIFIETKFFYQKINLPNWFYLSILIFLLTYNPLFYFGNFDPIEEGFWLGWLNHLLQGQVLYRDVASYHPPLLSWGLFLFSKILTPSLYHFRLYLHLLQILGVIIIFFSFNNIINNNFSKIFLLLLIISFTYIGVKNNNEIRLALSLIPLIPLYHHSHKPSSRLILISGLLTSVSIFSSIEVGIAAAISSTIFLLLTTPRSKIINHLTSYFFGIIIIALPIIILLFSQHALSEFISQIFYYSKAFSQGYLNTPIERPETLTLLQWHKVNQFFGSTALFWELSRFGLALGLIFSISNLKLSVNNKYILALSLNALILSRSALARSDGYHIINIIIIALIIITYIIQEHSHKYKYAPTTILLVIGLFFARTQTQLGLLQNQLIKLQTYANPEGTYPYLTQNRTNIIVDIDTDPQIWESLLSYINTNTEPLDPIFIYPANPELYFILNRNNATRYDTPLAFFTEKHQNEMVQSLQKNKPKLIIYVPNRRLASLNTGSLSIVDEFIKTNYKIASEIGEYQIREPITP